jgi:hypothetical protein
MVKTSLQRACAHLERVEQWPTWAPHIRRIELRPPGSLTLESEGTIQLNNGIRSTFRMEELTPGRNWKWAGPFLSSAQSSSPGTAASVETPNHPQSGVRPVAPLVMCIGFGGSFSVPREHLH